MKSSGEDIILNEFIEYTVVIMCPIYTYLFNVVLRSGVVPETV